MSTDRLLREWPSVSVALPPELLEEIAQRTAEIVLERLDAATGSPSPWLSIAESATYLRVSERKLQRLIEKERVRSTTVGRRRLLHRDDLDAFAKTAAGEE